MSGLSKKIIRVALIGTAILGLCAAGFVLFAPDQVRYWSEIHEGTVLVLKIESFRRQYGRLPDSAAEVPIGEPDSLRFFYQKCAEDEYRLWFGTRLGESMTYGSDTRRWDSLNRSCGN